MPPKLKINREDIINTALELIRKHGVQSINARTVANALNCSTQPVFSNFSSMEELRLAVIEKASALFEEYMKREAESGLYPHYKAGGMAYIRFAKEEKELFKLLYMCDRSPDRTYPQSDLNNRMEALVHNNTGLEDESSKLFHLEMWSYVHGIATMLATDFLDLSWDLISKMLSDVYLGLRKQYETEQNYGSDTH